MQVKRTDLNPCTVQLEVVCSCEQVESGFTKAAKEYAKRIKVPGFRPGAAPKAMVEKLIDQEELARAAIDEIIRNVLSKALEQEDIKPDNSPAVNVTKFDRELGSCEFVAKVPLPPIVKMGAYKGLVVQRPPIEVSEEEVDKQIEELRQHKGKRSEVTGRGINEGDMAVVNIKPDGETGEGKSFMVIVGQTFGDLDKALMGMNAEEIKHANLNFPGSFQEKEWASKKLDATITVRSVSTTQAPELDDEFAQSLKADDLKDLRVKVRASIERAKAEMSQEMVNEQLFDQLMRSSEIEVPDTTWEQVANQRLQEMAYELGRQKKTVEDYAKETGMTIEELIAAQQAEAKVHVKRAVLIENIFKEEKMAVDNNDANRHFLQIASENQVPEEQLTKFAKKYGGSIRNEIIFRTMHAKVVEFLNDNAVEGDAPKAAPKKKVASEAPVADSSSSKTKAKKEPK